MIAKTIHFLAGLPRTGSTLLGSLLAQNPLLHVTPTSPLCPLLTSLGDSFRLFDSQHHFDHAAISKRVYHATVEAFYADIEQPIIFDKSRGWPQHVEPIKEFINPTPRIICPVRPIAEIITSYLTLADRDPDNFIDAHLKRDGIPVTNEARAHLLWTFYISRGYEPLVAGLKTHPENILLIDYRDIVFQPEQTLGKIYQFCGMEPFPHYYDGIENYSDEKDAAWGMRGLHAIRPALTMQSQSPLACLPKEAVEYFHQFDIKATP